MQRLFDSIVATTAHLDRVEVVLYIDDDDPDSHVLDSPHFHVTKIIGPAQTMGQYNTTCLARSRGEIVILANDDMVIRTRDWDDRVAEVHAEYSDGVYLAYCNDLFKNRGWCTFPILSRRACELLVDPYPVVYRGAFIDTHLVDIFKRIEHAGAHRTRYLKDVVFEHLHYRVGKADFDETYRKRGRFLDDQTFVALSSSRRECARRLLAAIEGHADTTGPPPVGSSNAPSGLPSALILFCRTFLLDAGLPMKWRVFLWYWFVGRYLAAHGWLGPLGREP